MAKTIKGQVKAMTWEEKIGQMVMVGVEGYILDDNTRLMIEKFHVGGFILFGRNIKDTDQIIELTSSLKNASKNDIPLLISIDEEGGRVSRLPGVAMPSSKTIGYTKDSDRAYENGRALAKRIKSLGFNLNNAPVLDINSNPNNPVIGDRAFSDESEVVTNLGVQTMKGIQAEGIISVIKHFPGHGDTSIDSHKGLPRVDHDLDRLQNFELIPFREAINNRADAVMTAHILLPKLDPHYPATLSKTVITDILRQDLNFGGVIITDDMTMAAIKDNYDLGKAAVKAVNAGVDIVLVCHEHANYIAVIEALEQAVKSGNITKARIDGAVHRILKLKQKISG